MDVPLEKYNVHNFPTWKVKIQMQFLNKYLWDIVNGTEVVPTNAKKKIDWESREEKAKSIIGLALSDSQLHRVDLEKFSKEIWDELNKLF